MSTPSPKVAARERMTTRLKQDQARRLAKKRSTGVTKTRLKRIVQESAGEVTLELPEEEHSSLSEEAEVLIEEIEELPTTASGHETLAIVVPSFATKVGVSAQPRLQTQTVDLLELLVKEISELRLEVVKEMS